MLLSVPAAAYSGHGNGTIDDPYQISSVDELNEIRNDLSAHYILMRDLDLSEQDTLWKPIGDYDNPFNGTFNGNLKYIKNLDVKILDYEEYAGLFGRTSGDAVIFDLTLINTTVECAGSRYAGSLVGYNEGDIINCRAVNTFVLSSWGTGGLIGANRGGTIVNCSAEGRVIGGGYAGGLVGHNHYGRIKTSHSNASVTGGIAGGLIGMNMNGSISNCMSEGSVYGYDWTGGFAGGNVNGGEIEFCYTKNTVDAKTGGTGGFVGLNQGYMNDCIAINRYVNNLPFTLVSKVTLEYPPYSKYVFGTGGAPIGRIAGANYYPGNNDWYTAKIENCYSWKETKTNRWRFSGVNGIVVSTVELKSFPESVWSEWDQTIWEKGDDGFPVIKQNLPENQ
jgi:hypothetical protein